MTPSGKMTVVEDFRNPTRSVQLNCILLCDRRQYFVLLISSMQHTIPLQRWSKLKLSTKCYPTRLTILPRNFSFASATTINVICVFLNVLSRFVHDFDLQNCCFSKVDISATWRSTILMGFIQIIFLRIFLRAWWWLSRRAETCSKNKII